MRGYGKKTSFFSNCIYLRNTIAQTYKYVIIAQRDVLKENLQEKNEGEIMKQSRPKE